MPKVRYLKIRFANAMFPAELPYFRAAVIEATRRQSSLFHNHDGDGFHYRYPLIQYKITDRKASIVCLDSGTDDIHYLLQQRCLDLRIGRREERFEIEDVQLHYHQLQSWQAGFHYALKDWQALNQENFRHYEALATEPERLQFLQKMLLGNVLALARSLHWAPEHSIELQITRIKDQRWLPYKGRRVLCFSLHFTANVSLPDYVGLGKGVSVGFGSVLGVGNAKSEGGKRKVEGRERKSERGKRNSEGDHHRSDQDPPVGETE